MYQLVGHELLAQTEGEYPILKLTKAAWDVMKGSQPVRLVQLAREEKARGKGKRTVTGTTEVATADQPLFEALRTRRRQIADKAGVPAFLVFSDVVLRALAQVRPQTLEAMRAVSGIGEVKLANYGAAFLEVMQGFGPSVTRALPAVAEAKREVSGNKAKAYELFRGGAAVVDVAHQTGLARSTVGDYLSQFILDERPESLDPWVPPEVYTQVADAADWHGTERLKPIFDALGGAVSYDDIRAVLAHLGPTVAKNGGV